MMKQTLLTASALALLAAVPAMAQSRVVSAGERLAANNAPLGVRAGSFLVIPKVDVEGTYDDNLYATKNNEVDDTYVTVRPEVAVKSNWSRHALNAVANVEVKRYLDKDSEDVENYKVALDGRADVLRDTFVGGGIGYERKHEDRGDPNSVASAVEPTEYDVMTARAGAFRGLGKANLRFDSEYRNLEYKNGRTASNAVVLNSRRDRTEYEQALRVGYKFTPSTEAFVKGTIDTRAYDFKGNAGSRNRSNHGQTYVAGLNFDLTGKTKGEVFVGTTERNYVDPGFKDIDEATWGGNVTYNFSDLTTLKAGITRGIEETTQGASSGFVATDYVVGVEHALRRNVLLNGKVGYSQNEYQGFAAGQRDDEIMMAGAGVDYWINRNFKAGVGYEYRNRESNLNTGDYSRNKFMVKLTATY
ncbi:MAG: outer membrane beta-barrel protein [Alphaproteobacteria bacterium]|nr:outer membrane beta-barrel protein [Alphaproteobacteria bacterium]